LRCLEVPSSQRTPQEQLESTVWITDADTAYRLANVVEQRGDKLVVGFRDENGFYEKRTVLIKDTQAPSLSYFCEDLCNLSELTDANVLHAIRCRYEAQLIHTYSGLFCVVVNPWRNLSIYSEEIMVEYANALDKGTSLPPHVYAVAQSAYDGLFSGSNQSILITGESGAGKTENTKKIIEYLGVEAHRRSGVEKNGTGADKRLAAANLIIESFANASTVHNSNSSRVGKFIRIDFGDDMELKGAQIQCYLLEKSRVVSQNEGDRNFHIFYQLLSKGFDEAVRYDMGLGQSADAYRFLNQGGKTVDRDIDDAKGAYDTEHALDVIGFNEEEKRQIYEVVASCILLGEIKFNERSGLDITYVDGHKEVEAACRILGVKTCQLVDALTAPSIKVGDTVIKKSQNLRKHALDVIGFNEEEKRQIYEVVASCILLGEIKFNERSGLDITYVDGHKEVEAACRILGVKTCQLVDALTAPSIKVGDTVIKKSQNLRKTLSSLSALCKCIYERLFNFILSRCNDALGKSFSLESSTKTTYVGVLDMAGFEIMKRNSFEQFCINYTNEKLQQFFNDFMFIREQKEYMREGIDWKEVNYGTDMQNTIELIEKPLGLLSLLQEECVVPNGSDISLLEKLVTTHASNPVFARSKQSARNTTISHFSVVHYAGMVQYNIDGWVEKNKDAVERSGLEVLSQSCKPIIKALFPKLDEEMTRSRRQSLCASTVSHVYKEQLLNLLETLNTTRAQFIRCISPNDHRQPGVIDPHLVLHQLRCNGVLEGVRICRQGYPNRLPFDEFVSRYKLLAADCECEENRSGAEKLCRALDLDPAVAQIGTTKVFCKVGIISELENRRRARLSAVVVGIQAAVRWYNEQKEYRRKLRQKEALVVIQRNVRNYAELSSWKWYRLLGLVRQLIPMNKDRERIEELEKENEDLLSELSETQEQYERLERLLEEARKKILALESEKNDREDEKREMRAEMLRNEEVMAIMEKRFDEQHSKVMKIHSCLRENEKKLEQIEVEKCELVNELTKWKEKYERENARRVGVEKEFAQHEQTVKVLQQKMDAITTEREREGSRLERVEGRANSKGRLFFAMLRTWNEEEAGGRGFREKIHSCLRENEKKLEQIEVEKCELVNELTKWKEKYERENARRVGVEKEFAQHEQTVKVLQQKMDAITTEREREGSRLERLEAEFAAMNDKNREQLSTINDLQRRICELNEKCRDCDSLVSAEKKARRKAENEKADKESELGHLQERMQKSDVKIENLWKEKYERENARRVGVEKEFAQHEQTVKVLQQKMDAITTEREREGSRLERLEAEFAAMNDKNREQLSTINDLQRRICELNEKCRDCDSLVSAEKKARRKAENEKADKESELGHLQERMQKSDVKIENLVESYSLSRSNSQSQLANERKIAQLERQIMSAHTDIEIQKREIEVYKASLVENEKERDALSHKVRTMTAAANAMERSISEEERKSHEYELRLKKAQEDLATLREKYEKSVKDSQNELLEEKRKMRQKMDDFIKEHEAQQASRNASLEKTLDETQEQLAETRSQLDRAIAQVTHLESLSKSQGTYGETWENQYRLALAELESLRDENATLKMKIRRQYKQIELLTQQSEMEADVAELESRIGLHREESNIENRNRENRAQMAEA
ncbi:Myosin heavy chain, striated muscle, partial [Toxocara canis]